MQPASRSARRLATALTSLGLAALIATGSVLAGTPVTNGWRDHAYGGGAFRPSSDKPQSKLWFTDEGGGNVQWWAGMFRWSTSPSLSEYRIYKLSSDKATWGFTPSVVDRRDNSHGDYLWDESNDTLYVASVAMPNVSAPFALPTPETDEVRVFRYTYDNSTENYTQVGGSLSFKTISGTGSTAAPEYRGGAWSVTIDKDSNDRLWVVLAQGTKVLYSTSDDDGETWTPAAQLPSQATNPINVGMMSDSDIAAVIAFGNGQKDTVGVMWSDQDNLPANTDNGYWFSTIAAGADPSVLANWSTDKLPKLSGLSTNDADNHISIKGTSDGTLYMVGKTRAETAQCASQMDKPSIPFFRRTAGGTWTTYLAGTVGDCETRPQLVIDEQTTPDIAYVFVTSPNGGGAIYRKSAPLSGPDAFDFRGPADTIPKRGVAFIKSATETLIDDASTTKQTVTDASGVAVIANNLTSSGGGNAKVYLHNYMSLPASDVDAPVGTVSINGGAATTDKAAVTLSVSASDPGSGLSLVRVSNDASVDGSGRLNGADATSYTYAPSVAWTLTAGLGIRTVYAQWRDAAGNWSTPVSDDIEVVSDTTAPLPPSSVTHSLSGSGGRGIPVRISWTAGSDPGGSGVRGYRVWRSVNGGAYAIVVPETASRIFNTQLANSTATYRFRVQTIDVAGNIGSPRYGPTFRTRSYSESNSAMKFTTGWGLSTSTVYAGGKAKYSTRAGRSVSLTFTGNRVAWLSRLGPTHGYARVYINGVLSKTVNLHSATYADRQLVYSKSWTTVRTRTIKIVVLGTAGHPRVVVDQIYVLR
jgi:hypothetical protein